MSSDDILNSIDGRRLGWNHDGNLHFKGQGIQEFRAAFVDIPDDSYTLTDRDTGSVIVFTSASAVTLNLAPGVKRGFNCMILQWGAGNVQFVVGGGATLNSRFGGNALGGQYAGGCLMVAFNDDDNSAEWWFGGDGA